MLCVSKGMLGVSRGMLCVYRGMLGVLRGMLGVSRPQGYIMYIQGYVMYTSRKPVLRTCCYNFTDLLLQLYGLVVTTLQYNEKRRGPGTPTASVRNF